MCVCVCAVWLVRFLLFFLSCSCCCRCCCYTLFLCRNSNLLHFSFAMRAAHTLMHTRCTHTCHTLHVAQWKFCSQVGVAAEADEVRMTPQFISFYLAQVASPLLATPPAFLLPTPKHPSPPLWSCLVSFSRFLRFARWQWNWNGAQNLLSEGKWWESGKAASRLGVCAIFHWKERKSDACCCCYCRCRCQRCWWHKKLCYADNAPRCTRPSGRVARVEREREMQWQMKRGLGARQSFCTCIQVFFIAWASSSCLLVKCLATKLLAALASAAAAITGTPLLWPYLFIYLDIVPSIQQSIGLPDYYCLCTHTQQQQQQ